MAVKVRDRPPGSDVWWVFVDFQGRRKAKMAGIGEEGRERAELLKKKVELRLDEGLPAFVAAKRKKTVPTLGDYYGRFRRTYMETTLKQSTRDSYERSFRLYLIPRFQHLALDRISREKLKGLVAELVKKGLAKDTIRLIVGALGILYSDAIENEIIEKNPTLGLTKFYRQAKVRHGVIEPLTEDESGSFLQAAFEHAQKYYGLFLCALHTGLRSGEIAGLQWTDIDWKGSFVWVRRQIVRGRIETLKTKNGRRKVDLSDELISVLRELRRTRQEQWLKMGTSEIPGWIFCNRDGGFLDMYNVKRRHFKRVLRKAGLRDIRFHDLRHSYSSLLLAQGEPITYVSQQLGHANPQITLKIYSHWIPNKSQRKAVNRLPSLKRASK